MPRFWRCLLPALLAMAMVWGWMALTVRYSYGGNWTGLFCTGEFFPVPPALAAERIHIFPNTVGYDGQAFHYIAHDPFFKRGFADYVDRPQLRYRRVLISLLAWAGAMGDDRRIDAALIAVIVGFTGLGVYWLARLSLTYGRPAWAGMLFLLAPSVLVSIDRILSDGALAAFCVGFVLYWREKRFFALWLICLAAGLTRETGLALAGGMFAYCIVQRDVRRAAWFGVSIVPALAWYWFCARNTHPEGFGWLGAIPFEGLAWRLFTPGVYDLPKWIALACNIFDVVGALGIVLALWAVWKKARARSFDAPSMAIYLYALLTIFLSSHDAWGDVYAFGRTLAPLLVLLALDGFEGHPLRASAPALLMLPRIGLQVGRQVLNVAGGLLGR